MDMNTTLKRITPLLVVFTVLIASNFIDAAWTNPMQAPPLGNVAAPINESITNQLKQGDITARNLKAGLEVWSPAYCDENGLNCFTASDVNSSPPPPPPPSSYEWRASSYGACGGGRTGQPECGLNSADGSQSRNVYCVNTSTGATVADSNCSGAEPISTQGCSYTYYDDRNCRCFIAGTQITMADGTNKNIEDVQIGEYVLGKDGVHNEVLGFERPQLGSRPLYSINNGPFFVTPAHPLHTTEGWKSISMDEIYRENTPLVAELDITVLKIGDELVRYDGTTQMIESIVGRSENDQTLYNFRLSGDRTYFVDGFLTHTEFAEGEE